MEHVDYVIEAIFQRLCIRQIHGAGPDKSMSLTELRLALGVTDAQVNEALRVLTFPGDHRIEHPAKDRVLLGRGWRERCGRPL